MGFDVLVAARQIHGSRVHVVRHAATDDHEIDGVDALVSALPGVGLMIQQADCQAVLLADPITRVAGICHSGWRGSVANIIDATITTMHDCFGSRPADLVAAISPSLGPCCAEFVNFERELPLSLHRFGNSERKFDFWAVSIMQLHAAGVQRHNIQVDGRCTVCDRDFFSYRRDKQTGRCASVIGVKHG